MPIFVYQKHQMQDLVIGQIDRVALSVKNRFHIASRHKKALGGVQRDTGIESQTVTPEPS